MHRRPPAALCHTTRQFTQIYSHISIHDPGHRGISYSRAILICQLARWQGAICIEGKAIIAVGQVFLCAILLSVFSLKATIAYAVEACYSLTLGHSGLGTDPIPSLSNSPICTQGNYVADEGIHLVAVPDPGWGQSGWTGTNKDNRIGTENRLTMPAANHAVSVTYSANLCFPLTLGHSGSGADPSTWDPIRHLWHDKSLICRLGEYSGADIINVTAAPDPRWTVDSWTGTDDDTSSSPENVITMPESEYSVTVAYTESTDGFVSKLITSSPTPGGFFGMSVAISSDTVVVGSPGEYALTADVFERNQDGPDRWGMVKNLVPAEPVTGGSSARAVSISGDTIAIGERPNTLGEPGAVHIFERNHGGPANWGVIRKIQAPEEAEGDWFGESVAIDGSTLAVGAPFDADGQGVIWIFERDLGGPDNWGMVKKVLTWDLDTGDQNLFGLSLAIEGDLLVGYNFSDSSPDEEMNPHVAFFERNHGGVNNWGQVKKVVGAAIGEFGNGLTVSVDTVAVGDRSDGATGINSGSVSIYRRDAGGVDNWGLVRKLLGAGSQDRLGASVALSSDILVAGATDTSFATPGQARVFSRDQGGADNWGVLTTLSPYDGSGGDLFGWATDMDGATVVVGTPYIGEWDFGSAYIFELRPASPCHSLVLSHTGSGADPVASPLASPDCSAGLFEEGEVVTLTANPDPDWTVGSWSGSDNDSSTSTVNTVNMPDVDHAVTVNYSAPDLIFSHSFEQEDN